MLTRYRSVLSVPGSPRLLSSALVGRLPQGMSSLAVLLLVRATTHSYAAAGAAVGAYALASAMTAPVQGRLVDRFGRRNVLAPSAVAQGLALICLVLLARGDAPVAPLVAASALAGALVPPIAPTVRALLREVMADAETRESAYALEAVAQESVWIVGPLFAALIVTLTSPSGAVLAVGIVCILGTILFVRSPLAADRPRRAADASRIWALSSARLRALLVPVALMGVGLGAVEIGLPAIALHAGQRWASGLLLALWSVGSMAGGLWYGSRSWHSPLHARYRMLLVLAVAFTAPLIVARSVPAAVVCSLLAGLAIAPAFSCQYALVGRAVESGTENEAFTWVTAALVGGLAAGSALGGAAIAAAGVGAPAMLACAATALSAAVAGRLPRVLAAQPAGAVP